MEQFSKIKIYLEKVINQVRYTKIRNELSHELENHILDQKDAYIAQVEDEETAVEKSILQMGDPVMVGTELDRAHRPRIEWSIVILTLILLLTGTIISNTRYRHANSNVYCCKSRFWYFFTIITTVNFSE